jgi:hypothetical protein
MSASLIALTVVHTALSLIALLLGLWIVWAMIRRRALAAAEPWYLATSLATSLSGFAFPVTHFLPSHAVGLLSVLLLAAALYARYAAKLAGTWRKVYAATVSLSVYLLVFVSVAQAFSKVAALKALAPTLQEPPFAAAQGVVLVLFVIVTVLTVRATSLSASGVR